MSKRLGDWMQTYTGVAFYPMDPRPEEISIYDIAHALANICRYGGHSRYFYSVAEHSCLVSEFVSEAQKFDALMHDAAEAYVGDMVRPLKLSMPEFCSVENKIRTVIAEKFGISAVTSPEIHLVDTRILLDERDLVLGIPPQSWGTQIESLEKLGVEIALLNPESAECMFLDMWEDFSGKNGRADE